MLFSGKCPPWHGDPSLGLAVAAEADAFLHKCSQSLELSVDPWHRAANIQALARV